MPPAVDRIDVGPWVNGGAFGLLSLIIIWGVPQFIKAIREQTKAIRLLSDMMEMNSRCLLVISMKVRNPTIHQEEEIHGLEEELNRAKRAVHEDPRD